MTPVTYRIPRPRRRPNPYRQPLRRRPSYRPPADPRHTKPKGVATVWTHIRRLLWSWWPWAILAVYYIDQRNWWAAFGIASWSAVCSLSTPAEFPPQYGLDHNLTVGDPEFINTMSGAAGVPFVGGNAVALLNNGDQFYPPMLEAIASAERSITIEAYIYWSGEIGLQFATALADAAKRGVRVKILLDAVGSSSLSAEILKVLEGARLSRCLVQPDSLESPAPRSTTARIASRCWSTAASALPAAPASPTTGPATHRTTSTGATCRSALKGRRCARCRPVLRRTGWNARAS